MRIVSWNINSVRLREKLVVKLMKKLDPDVICLQETKCPNDQFPEKAFAKAGFAISLRTALRAITASLHCRNTKFSTARLSIIAKKATGGISQ